uniref:EH domain-containing protein n=1 Tax=Strongyloides venezuelensis TaxID=75913 RepID=A0A0K0FJN5_STRVS
MQVPFVPNFYYISDDDLGSSNYDIYQSLFDGIPEDHPGYPPDCFLFVAAKLFNMNRADWERISSFCLNPNGFFDRHSFFVFLKIAAVQQANTEINEANLKFDFPVTKYLDEDWKIPQDRLQIYQSIFDAKNKNDGKITKEDVYQTSKIRNFMIPKCCEDYFYLTDFDKDGYHDFPEFVAIMELIHKTLTMPNQDIQDNVQSYLISNTKVFPFKVIWDNLRNSGFNKETYETKLTAFVPGIRAIPIGDPTAEFQEKKMTLNCQNVELSRTAAQLKRDGDSYKSLLNEHLQKIEEAVKRRDGVKLRANELKNQIRSLEQRQKDGKALIDEKKEHLENLKRSYDKQKDHLETEKVDLLRMRKITNNVVDYKNEMEQVIADLQQRKYELTNKLVSERDFLIQALNDHLKKKNSLYSNDRLLSLVDEFKIYKPYIDDRIAYMTACINALDNNQIPNIGKAFVRFQSTKDGIYEPASFPNSQDLI